MRQLCHHLCLLCPLAGGARRRLGRPLRDGPVRPSRAPPGSGRPQEAQTGPTAEIHCAARAAKRVQRSRNAFSSITMTKPGEGRGPPLYIRIHRWTSHTIGQSHCIATYRKVSLNPSIAAHRTIAAYRSISRNIAEYRGISREIRGVAARSRTIAYHRRPSRDVAGRRDAAPSQDVATPRTIAGART